MPRDSASQRPIDRHRRIFGPRHAITSESVRCQPTRTMARCGDVDCPAFPIPLRRCCHGGGLGRCAPGTGVSADLRCQLRNDGLPGLQAELVEQRMHRRVNKYRRRAVDSVDEHVSPWQGPRPPSRPVVSAELPRGEGLSVSGRSDAVAASVVQHRQWPAPALLLARDGADSVDAWQPVSQGRRVARRALYGPHGQLLRALAVALAHRVIAAAPRIG
jgi:hypothetical protein